MLWALYDFHGGITQKVGFLERLEPEVVEEIVPVVTYTGVNDVRVGLGDIVEVLGNVGDG